MQVMFSETDAAVINSTLLLRKGEGRAATVHQFMARLYEAGEGGFWIIHDYPTALRHVREAMARLHALADPALSRAAARLDDLGFTLCIPRGRAAWRAAAVAYAIRDAQEDARPGGAGVAFLESPARGESLARVTDVEGLWRAARGAYQTLLGLHRRLLAAQREERAAAGGGAQREDAV